MTVSNSLYWKYVTKVEKEVEVVSKAPFLFYLQHTVRNRISYKNILKYTKIIIIIDIILNYFNVLHVWNNNVMF